MSENEKAVVVRQPASLDIMSLGQVFYQSGYFKDAKSAAQAVVKIQAGAEVGLPPVASMTGIYIVQDKVTFSAVTMAALIKKSRRYTYRVKEMTEQACEVEFFELMGEKYEPVGVSRFTMQDADKAQLTAKPGPWKQYPRNMLFSRALSNGARWYTPDIFGGPVYTPDELGAEVSFTREGDIVVQEVAQPQSNGHEAEPTEEPPEDVHMCPVHNVPFKRFDKQGRTWYSHKDGDGWCNEDRIRDAQPEPELKAPAKVVEEAPAAESPERAKVGQLRAYLIDKVQQEDFPEAVPANPEQERRMMAAINAHVQDPQVIANLLWTVLRVRPGKELTAGQASVFLKWVTSDKFDRQIGMVLANLDDLYEEVPI